MDDKEVLILNTEYPLDEDSRSPYTQTTFRIRPITSSFTQNKIQRRVFRCSAIDGLIPRFRQVIRLHGKPLLSGVLTITSATGSFICFPLYLEKVTTENKDTLSMSDAYSACLILTTLSMAFFLLTGFLLKAFHWLTGTHRRLTVFMPGVSWSNIAKIGVSTGLSLMTLCYAWEDNKVLCNLQLPLLGFVFVFASITHALSRWRDLGFRRTFGILTVIGGVFISVDYTLVDHERCRGINPPPKDPWTWKVHLVWTLAFVVAIWLWTVAMFSMESAIPLPQTRLKQVEERGVKMKVLRVSSLNGGVTDTPRSTTMMLNKSSLSSNDIYSRVPLLCVFNSLLWFHVATWLIVLSLFWTEFIPGFGKGIRDKDFSLVRVLEDGFLTSVLSAEIWVLLICGFIFAHTFTHLLLLLRSPLIAIGVMCLGFPAVALWWSLFQIQSPFLLWMPMMSELICALLGFPLILGGLVYLYSLDVRRSQPMHIFNP